MNPPTPVESGPATLKLRLISGSALTTKIVYALGSTLIRGHSNGSPHRLARDNRREWTVQTWQGAVSHPTSFANAKKLARQLEDARA